MKNVNYKTIIAPIVAVVALGYAAISGHAIAASVQTEIVDISCVVVGAGVSIWGIFHNHK